MPHSNFAGVLSFFDRIGVFEVLLPFLLVFTLVFALLEKTRIFGVEKLPTGEEYTRKNLNAMTAFSIAFFVVASSRIVEIITKVSANMIVLLLASVFFLLLVGSFHQEKKEGFFLEKGWRTVFMLIMFVGLAVIFLDAMKIGSRSWLQQIIGWLQGFGTNDVVPSIVLLLVMIGIIAYITHTPKPEASK
ncbi:hypothetical protein HY640_02990 [Candidatus Woesearchaeota archaeon]|nr:hypothetical protein [Candidatus Woesearchaeota archaeon]